MITVIQVHAQTLNRYILPNPDKEDDYCDSSPAQGARGCERSERRETVDERREVPWARCAETYSPFAQAAQNYSLE